MVRLAVPTVEAIATEKKAEATMLVLLPRKRAAAKMAIIWMLTVETAAMTAVIAVIAATVIAV